MKTIRERELKTLLKKMRGNKTMEEFGAPYGAKKQAVYQWEIGKAKPNAAVLKQMGITIEYSGKIED